MYAIELTINACSPQELLEACERIARGLVPVQIPAQPQRGYVCDDEKPRETGPAESTGADGIDRNTTEPTAKPARTRRSKAQIAADAAAAAAHLAGSEPATNGAGAPAGLRTDAEIDGEDDFDLLGDAEPTTDPAAPTQVSHAAVTTMDELREVARRVMDEKGMVALAGLLAKHGVAKISATPPEKITALGADLHGALA